MSYRLKGIDLSHWNQVTDYKAIRADGYQFAILKAGENFKIDPSFHAHYMGCQAAGIHVGAYYFAPRKFDNGKVHAESFLSLIEGYELDFPIFVDIEAQSILNRTQTTKATIDFCSYCEKSGYYTGIYGSDISTFSGLLNTGLVYKGKTLKEFVWWVARYRQKPPEHLHGIWQQSSTGKVNGIVGNVDINVSIYDYSKYC